ncbi:hypothetical protein BKA61DRAFT_645872 [Leptodontidium sp. MPI-SDFR-AT-0119]|nr:hypothetical protein BKA61DRAFT_645872 [Leptodontidium sp. MPI-SDFR-AT-0119]
MASAFVSQLLTSLPAGFDSNISGSVWGVYDTKQLAVLPGNFNRTTFQAPWSATVDDEGLQSLNDYLNTTDFVAFDPSFFSIIGSSAKVEHIITQPTYLTHEASCFIKSTSQLHFASWGFDHSWQYYLDTTTNELHNITTSPPTWNAHGCVYYNGSVYIATDTTESQYGSIVKVNPETKEAETLINNFYQQPFLGFNDIEIDRNGNFWVTDSISAWGRSMTNFWPQTTPAVYFINGTTLAPKWVFQTPGNANGIAISSSGTLYVDVTDVSSGRPNVKDPLKPRQLNSYSTDHQPVLRDARLFSNSISYYCDGVRVSKNGLIWCAAGDGVDVIDKDGKTLGRVRVGGGDRLSAAVNIAFEEHVLWVVGRGGVWKVSGIEEVLQRYW